MVKFKRALIFLLATMMTTTIVGCSSGEDASSPNENTPSSTEKNTGEATVNDGPMTAYDPGIELKFGRMIDQSAEMPAKLEQATGEKLTDNRWTRAIKEQLGITVNYTLMGNWEGYNQKLKMGMVSGDLPDFYQVPNFSDLNQLMAADALEEMGPIYEKYSSPLLKKVLEMETKRAFDPVTYNGKIYAIPIKMPSTNDYNHLWIREDWLKKLGLERPKTIQDVYDIAVAFTKNDPDGNGKDDTIGLNMDNGFIWNMRGFFHAFNAYPNHWLEESDGTIVRGVIKPEMKKPLALLQTMYKEGLVDKEFGAKDNGKASENYVSGKCGMFYGPHWDAFAAENTMKNDPNAKWITLPLPSETGETVKVPLTISVEGGFVVKKGAKNPEALVKIFNLYVEKIHGEKAEFNKYFGGDGIDSIWQMAPVYSLDPMIDLIAHQDIKKAIKEGTTDKLTGSGAGFYKNMKDGMWPFSMMFGPENTPFAYVDATYPKDVFWNAYFGAPTPTMVERWSTMDELITTTFTSIVQGKTEVDSGFDKMVNEWLNMGGKQVTDEVNQARGK
jgi:putative aldouronate transport system substrate-binding protein